MASPILATKLYPPPPRPDAVDRPRLIARLSAGAQHGLTLISAPAGFGKTTLLASWLASRQKAEGKRQEGGDERLLPSAFDLAPFNVAWLSLDPADGEPTRFLAYLAAALQTAAPQLGAGVAAALQTPRPPPVEALLTALLNEIAALPEPIILVLDDYQLVEAAAVDQTLTFLVDHLPPQLHLVIATREDPGLPLARYRARGRLAELRAADLRFTPAEAAEFLGRTMGLSLGADAIAAIEARTEGWIAGLHLAALALQGQPDPAGFLATFTGGHQFILDYLVEEVLQRQPDRIQRFLLRTATLDRLCGPLCDALLRAEDSGLRADVAVSQPSALSPQPSALILEELERTNLFIVPLDTERRWYRYHQLFQDLLRRRRDLRLPPELIAADHTRASQWFEDHDLLPEAFAHAAAANDVARAERLVASQAMPVHDRGTALAILSWLESLPRAVRDAHPALWVRSATLSLVAGRTTGVEAWLQAAERALPPGEPGAATRALIGTIAAARATLALTRYDAEAILAQARRALEHLPADSLGFRFTAFWAMGFAQKLQGDRAAATRAYREAISISERSGDRFSTALATDSLGQLQEQELQLFAAAESYRRVLELCGPHPQPNVGETHLGLARIAYAWNDLEAADRHGRESLRLLRQYDVVIDRYLLAEVFLAQLELARGDLAGASERLARAAQDARRLHFTQRMPEVAAAQVLALLRAGDLPAAAQLAWSYDLPLSRARVHLARREPEVALALLEPLRRQAEAGGRQDERLSVLVLQALAQQAHGEPDQAALLLHQALALAEPGGYVRVFVDEGEPMRRLLQRMQDAGGGMMPYVGALLATWAAPPDVQPSPLTLHPLVEPLTAREREILGLIASGLSNRAIGERLALALDTVKGHNRRLFAKLQATSRTEALARARELGLL